VAASEKNQLIEAGRNGSKELISKPWRKRQKPEQENENNGGSSLNTPINENNGVAITRTS